MTVAPNVEVTNDAGQVKTQYNHDASLDRYENLTGIVVYVTVLAQLGGFITELRDVKVLWS